MADLDRFIHDMAESDYEQPLDPTREIKWLEWISEWNNEDLTVQQEFDWLRMNPKWSTAQAQRVKHLEDHLDKGDVFCKCYEGE